VTHVVVEVVGNQLMGAKGGDVGVTITF